jgi:hypothetical protein
MSTRAMKSTGSVGITKEQRIAEFFGLKGDNWMRHANAASVWSRFTVLSMLALSIWSREWIGWFSLIPITLSVIWMIANPLVFPVPRSTRNWASKGVLGERIWADRNNVDIPEQFAKSRVPMWSNVYSTVGLIFLTYGLVTLNLLPTIAGILIVHGGKLWYIDRMVLLFDDMKTRNKEYAAWEY